jgi:hypothetical protein
VSSNEPDGSGREVDGSEEVASGFVIAVGDGSEELEFSEVGYLLDATRPKM